jgi:hypothetical protein
LMIVAVFDRPTCPGSGRVAAAEGSRSAKMPDLHRKFF